MLLQLEIIHLSCSQLSTVKSHSNLCRHTDCLEISTHCLCSDLALKLLGGISKSAQVWPFPDHIDVNGKIPDSHLY